MAGSTKPHVAEHILVMLRQERKNMHMSQTELANRTSLSQNHISNIETGKIDPLSSTLIEIARALELEPVFVPRQMLAMIKAQLARPDSRQPLYRPDDNPPD